MSQKPKSRMTMSEELEEIIRRERAREQSRMTKMLSNSEIAEDRREESRRRGSQNPDPIMALFEDQERRSRPQSERSESDEQSLLEQSARDAAAESVSEDDFVSELKSYNDSLEPIREEIRKSRKPRMRTVEQYLCDSCDKTILSPRSGFVIHGNIYVADPNQSGGLIGNNFPETDEPVSLDCVKKTVLCKGCFIEAVGLGQREGTEEKDDRWDSPAF